MMTFTVDKNTFKHSRSSTLDSSSDLGNLRQLSDQQIIDVLRDDTDIPTINYVTVDPDYSGAHAAQYQLQSSGVEFICENKDLILDTGQQPDSQKSSLQFIRLNPHEATVSQYQTASCEPSVILTLNLDQDK